MYQVENSLPINKACTVSVSVAYLFSKCFPDPYHLGFELLKWGLQGQAPLPPVHPLHCRGWGPFIWLVLWHGAPTLSASAGIPLPTQPPLIHNSREAAEFFSSQYIYKVKYSSQNSYTICQNLAGSDAYIEYNPKNFFEKLPYSDALTTGCSHL